MITEQDIENACDFLLRTAKALGDATYDAVRADRMLKHIVALKKKEFNNLKIGDQEREAYASGEYLDALENDARAAAALAIIKAQREAAAVKIDVWRSLNANSRAIRL